MSERTFVPIFVFWAFLTIITPTLVLLSENSKQDIDLYGNSTEVEDDDRRMMGDREYRNEKTTPPCATFVATAPAEAPIVSLPTGANLTAVECRHNGSVGSNKSDDHGLRQVSPRKQLKQTKLQST